MPRRRRNVEEILATLREMENLTEEGMSVAAAAKNLGITGQTYYRWRTRYGSLSEDEAKRLTELDENRAQLRRVIEEQAQDISMLQDLTQGEVPSAARRRLAVAYLVDRYGISERRACRVVGQHRSTQRYGLTGRSEDGWHAAEVDLDDDMAQLEPGGQQGFGDRWREPAEGPERPHLVASTGEEVEAEVEVEVEVEAHAEHRPVSAPTGAPPHLALAPVVRIPLLDDRIPVLLRARTSLINDLVWLTRYSEMARLTGSAGVIDRIRHIASAPCRLVQLFGGHQEGRSV